MPLIKDGRFVQDDWARPDGDVIATGTEKPILPFAALSEHGAALAESGKPVGVELSNDVDPDALIPWLDRLALISVQFPKAADGRGYSIATRLRRLGFKGELRATGHVIADQYALARNCGFDTVEISDELADRQPEPHWLEADRAMTLAYQRGYGEMRNIVSARWATN